MNAKLVDAILMNKQSIRETIELFSVNEGPLSDLADALDAESSDEPVADQDADSSEVELVVNDEFPVKQLFVRRFKTGEEKPVKRVKCTSCAEALKLFFEWAIKYKNDQVEIWTSTASDAKNFYRFILKNREAVEELWKTTLRTKNLMQWTAAYRDVQQRARQSGSNLTGTLEPFNVLGK